MAANAPPARTRARREIIAGVGFVANRGFCREIGLSRVGSDLRPMKGFVRACVTANLSRCHHATRRVQPGESSPLLSTKWTSPPTAFSLEGGMHLSLKVSESHWILSYLFVKTLESHWKWNLATSLKSLNFNIYMYIHVKACLSCRSYLKSLTSFAVGPSKSSSNELERWRKRVIARTELHLRIKHKILK